MDDADEDAWNFSKGGASAGSEWDSLLEVLEQAKPSLFDATKLDELVAILPSIERRTAPLLAEALHDNTLATQILGCMSYNLDRPLENLAAHGFLANLKVHPLSALIAATAHAHVHPASLLVHVRREL